MKRTAIAVVSALALSVSAPSVKADPVGDFFKRLGRSISKPIKTPPRQQPRKSKSPRRNPTPAPTAAEASPTSGPEAPPPVDPPRPTAEPTPTQPPARVASTAPPSNTTRDLPFALPVPNRPGFVTSPYAPTRGYVDVRGFQSGTEVKDPFTGKLFLIP